MDIEQISADGIPLNIADTQARQDITEIKSNLTELVKHTTIEQNISANTSNCIEIGDLKIQFGTQQCTANQYTAITFKKSFTSTGYVCFASYTSVNATALNNPNASITEQTTTGAKIYSSGGIYGWVAIGY